MGTPYDNEDFGAEISSGACTQRLDITLRKALPVGAVITVWVDHGEAMDYDTVQLEVGKKRRSRFTGEQND